MGSKCKGELQQNLSDKACFVRVCLGCGTSTKACFVRGCLLLAEAVVKLVSISAESADKITQLDGVPGPPEAQKLTIFGGTTFLGHSKISNRISIFAYFGSSLSVGRFPSVAPKSQTASASLHILALLLRWDDFPRLLQNLKLHRHLGIFWWDNFPSTFENIIFIRPQDPVPCKEPVRKKTKTWRSLLGF